MTDPLSEALDALTTTMDFIDDIHRGAPWYRKVLELERRLGAMACPIRWNVPPAAGVTETGWFYPDPPKDE